MNPEQYDRILEKLLDDDGIGDEVRSLVDAACSGEAVLARLLDAPETSTGGPPRTKASRAPVPGVTVRSLEVRGFRGIGPNAKLELQPGPGLTLVIGRNGSGKSSFAEALEMLMTGDCRRWSGRKTVDWEHGWRNIHATNRALIRASFAVEGSAEVTVKRRWTDDALDSDVLEVRRGEESLSDLSALGWNTSLAAFRPFLSYSELGSLVEEPSSLYDQLESILGLEDVAVARKRLGEARRSRTRRKKSVREQVEQLLSKLEAIDDPRARACQQALSGRKWDLDEVERILTGDSEAEAVADVTVLQRLSQLEAPPSASLAEAARTARQALADEKALATDSLDRADQLSRILAEAVAIHEHDRGPCPVCEQPLPEGWTARAAQRIEEQTQSATAVREARARTKTSIAALRSQIQPLPSELRRASSLGLAAEAAEVWERWAAAPADPDALIVHVEELALALEDAVMRLREEAVARRRQLHDAWQPMARSLSEWLPDGRRVVNERELLKHLQAAEKWLGGVEEDLRNERFEPLAERAQQIWEILRQESSVSLQKVELEKAGRRRKVKLNVTVDDAQSVALAVMSQGELNALALSLFLPRMTLAETPFRFLVIDDPVQAMDPSKVDGLARVLAEVAETRQVIVFTHDTRLPEAVRRLQLPANVIEVMRHPDSTVETRHADDPVDRHLDDARALMKSEQELGPTLTSRVLPSFCRLAIEAACVAAIRRRRIGRGDRHEDVAKVLDAVKTTNTLVALALFDDADRGGDVLGTLNNKLGRAMTDAYVAIRGGAHGGWTGAYGELVRHAERIAHCLEAEA